MILAESILRQMNKRSYGNIGNLLESTWKTFSTNFPHPRVMVNLAAKTNKMTNKLLKMAFDKAEQECATKVTTKLSNHLSDAIFNISGEQYGERSLRTKYNNMISNPNEQVEFNQFVKDALSQYIGFENYLDFIKNSQKTLTSEVKRPTFLFYLKRKKWTTIAVTFVLITVLAYFMIDTQRWMEWQDGHYVEVAFDSKKLTNGTLKVFKKDRIVHFKKIEPHCKTEFFNKNGNTSIWYGKNHKKELEYFTDLGLHPETGKSLKPITTYMIKKYICEDYK